MKYPLIAPLAALSAGIWAAQYAEFTFRELSTSILLLAALAVVGLACRAPRTGELACLAGFALAGALRSSLPAPAEPHRIDRIEASRPALVEGWVRVPPTVRLDRDQFVLQVESAAGRPASGGIRVTAAREPSAPPLDLHYGDRIRFPARLHHLRNSENPGAFDRVTYLRRQGIYRTATLHGSEVRRLHGFRGSRFVAAVWRAREWAERRADHLMGAGSRHSALVKAMVLGDGAYLDRALGRAFQRTGTYHALVVSGSHVALMAWFSLWLFRVLRLGRGTAAIASFGAVLALVLLVGAQLPVVRAAAMVVLYLVGRHYHRERHTLNVIAAAALAMLLWDPQGLFDASFQLSFLCVALIGGVAMPILERSLEPYRCATRDLPNTDRDLHLEPRLAQTRIEWRLFAERLPLPPSLAMLGVASMLRLGIWTAELAVVSCVVQVGLTLPMAVYFHRVSWSGLSANLFAAPLLSAIVPVGFLAILTGWTVPAQCVSLLLRALVAVVEWHAGLTWLEHRVPAPPGWLAAAFAVALAGLSWTLHRARLRWPAALALLAAVALLVWHPFRPRLDAGRLELTTLDVGQGESLFLVLPGGQTILMDAGAARTIDLGEEVVSPYLWSRSIRRLDIVALSHAHADHIGGLPALLENFDVGELWVGANPPTADYRRLLETASRRRVPVTRLAAGDTRVLGSVSFEVLWPRRDYTPLDLPGNDDSLVLVARYGRRRFLLAGDIERKPEQRLARELRLPRVDLLKVPHHGSRTSTSADLLDAARPWLAVISAGFDNPYRHPHPDVLARLTARRIAVWRTDRDGLITVSTDGHRVTVEPHRRRF
jgi:competence protein ComEC